MLAEIETELEAGNTERAVLAVTTLGSGYAACEKAEQSTIRKAFSKLLNSRKAEWECPVCVAMVLAFAEMGKDGERVALRLLGDRKRMKQPALNVAALDSLGRHANPKHIDLIAKALSSLSGVSLATRQWEAWWKTNKSAKWPEPEPEDPDGKKTPR